jgi:nitric oxide reductase subunit B
MAFMTFTLTFAGIVQTHLQRVMGMNYMEVQDQLSVFYWMRFGSGLVVVIGVLMWVYATLGPKKQVTIVPDGAPRAS